MDNLVREIMSSVETGLIDANHLSAEELRPKLIYNDTKKGNTVLANIEKELKHCDSFWFSVAFITKSGLIVLKDTLKELENKGVQGKILTTNYLSFNEPDALRELLGFSNLEVKVYLEENFHIKGFMFQKSELHNFVVGSSNLTQGALKANKEWNLQVSSLDKGKLIKETNLEFSSMWESAHPLSEEWIKEYEEEYVERKRVQIAHKVERLRTYTLKPNAMQKEATKALANLRGEAKNKAILISATGTGKTYLSAFDVFNVKPKKMLFLVHREQILNQAVESFKDVLGNHIKTGKLSGKHNDYDADFLFATTSMMAKESVFTKFASDHFDYIIVDEAHRAGSEGYLRFLNYFKPQFLLGMTATPERMDGFDVYELFDHNIAYEIRLQRAMEEKLLCPFHYFGITELSIDGREIDDSEFENIFPYLISDERVNNIIDKIKFYGYSGNRVKGLIFCRSIQEAKELSNRFNEKGYRTIALTGEDSQEVREKAISRLEDDDYETGLDYIFTKDIFNEGVDVPSVNQIVMLRPTESSIIFVQQLGRGLRKFSDKEYVVILDFIGNYRKNFLIPIALSGDRSYNKDTIRKFVAEGNRIIPGCSTVNFDAIAKQRIYAAIDTANFSDVKLLREEYTNLKNMLGRIPYIKDFEQFGSIDILRIFDNKTLGSYHNFLKKYEKDYKVSLTPVQEEMLVFVSQKIVVGKRVYELQLLKRMLHYQKGLFALLAMDLEEHHGKKLTEEAKVNVAAVLTNQFVTSEVNKERFANSIFIEKDDDDYQISTSFSEALKDRVFVTMLDELIEFGLDRYQNYYSNNYKKTNFELYCKYTYEDVCKLLDWDKNIVAQNIGGYKYDEKTNTFPVFINYNKDENISDTINYEDRFISHSKLIALSKQSRTPDSKDIQQIFGYKENGTKIYLFVRKNKDDNISKEFYFLGEIYPVGSPHPVMMKNTDKKAVEITYQLDVPVREDIYDYLLG